LRDAAARAAHGELEKRANAFPRKQENQMRGTHFEKSRSTSRASLVGTACLAFGAASFLLGAASVAHAQLQACPVTFAVTNGTDPLSALQFSVNFVAAPAGGIDATSCTLAFPSDGVTDANVNNVSETMTFGWADSSPPLFPAGPGDFVTCDFVATTPSLPLSAHFNPVTVDDASEGTPIPTAAVPFPTMSATVGACAPTTASCGNEIVEDTETCDAGEETAGCDDDCTAVTCGDGNVNEAANEECDDGNVADGDGCGATCALECGDGNIDAGEECDDGNAVNGDGCSARCTETASCPASPRPSCVTGEATKNQVKFKDDIKNPGSDIKDNGQYKAQKITIAIADGAIGDPDQGTDTYTWCLYDGEGLLKGIDIAADAGPAATLWTCKLDPGKQSCKYKNADVVANGVAGISVKAGVAGKGQASISLKSKAGNFSAPTMPLVTPVTSQLLVNEGIVLNGELCISTTFTTPTKNDGLKGQFQAKQ
jgi:cysteine-rich repeat protein